MNDRPVVGVVHSGDDGDRSGTDHDGTGTDRDGYGDESVETVRSAVAAAGGRAVVITPEGAAGDPTAELASADYLVAVGESALAELASDPPESPVLPVDAGRGVRSVPERQLDAALESLCAGEFDREFHPVVTATVGDCAETHILFDAMLVTEEPAEISEYAVYSGTERVARFRADGVVVATPAGSTDYGRAAGGPVVEPTRGGALGVVVPIAPFATGADHWVLPLDSIELSIERDETPVELLADDSVLATVSPDDSVDLSVHATIETAVVADSCSRFKS